MDYLSVRTAYSFLTIPQGASENSKDAGSMGRTAFGVGAAVLGLSDHLRPQQIGCPKAGDIHGPLALPLRADIRTPKSWLCLQKRRPR